jgi:hypothetical protein
VLDAAVEPFGVLADHDEIHVVVARPDARQRADRADRGVEVKILAQADVDRAKATPDRGGQRALEREADLRQRVERVLR